MVKEGNGTSKEATRWFLERVVVLRVDPDVIFRFYLLQREDADSRDVDHREWRAKYHSSLTATHDSPPLVITIKKNQGS